MKSRRRSPVTLVGREDGDHEAKEHAHDGLTGTVPGGARRNVLGRSAGLP